MLGWEINIQRNKDLDLNNLEKEIARWNTNFSGLTWIEDLVKTGKAINLGSNRYPSKYSMKAAVFRSLIYNEPTTYHYKSIKGTLFGSQFVINNQLLMECPDNEELIVTAWDLS